MYTHILSNTVVFLFVTGAKNDPEKRQKFSRSKVIVFLK